MNCTYNLTYTDSNNVEHTQRFDSELALDGYIAEVMVVKNKGKYKVITEVAKEANKLINDTNFSDIVFDMANPQGVAESVSKIKTIKDDNAKHKQADKDMQAMYIDEDEYFKYERPYIGVNEFLSNFVTNDGEGHHLYPYFNNDNYWKERLQAWNKDGNATERFSENEIDCFFDGDVSKAEAMVRVDQTTAQKFRNMMEYKWASQGAIGEEIHKVLELFFTNPTKIHTAESIMSQYKFTHLDTNLINNTLNYAINLYEELKKNFEKQYGELTFFTELGITQMLDVPVNKKTGYLKGIIDLLVVDGNGNVHVIDYKTSLKPYRDFYAAKRAAFTYQLATYGRMLQRYGFNLNHDKVYMIAPIQMQNFTKRGTWEEPDAKLRTEFHKKGLSDADFVRWAPDSIVSGSPEGDFLLQDISSDIQGKHNIIENLNQFMMTKEWYSMQTKDLVTSVMETLKEWFPQYKEHSWDEQEIEELLQNSKAYEPNEAGYLVFQAPGIIKQPISVKVEEGQLGQAQAKLKTAVTNKLRAYIQTRTEITSKIIQALQNPETSDFEVNRKFSEDTYAMHEWFSSIFKKYHNNPHYTILNNTMNLHQLDEYGIIALHNNLTNTIDIVKISTQSLLGKFKKGNFKNRIGLFGNYESDLVEQQKTESLVTAATYGNIELMETMLVLNNLVGSFKRLDNFKIGKIQLANPFTNRGLSMSNEELLYNYSELCKKSNFTHDQLLDPNSPVKFANKFQLLMDSLQTILEIGNSKRNVYLRSCKSDLEDTAEKEAPEKIKALQKFIADLQSKEIRLSMDTRPEQQNTPEVQVYNAAVLALADLKGIKLRQQIEKYGEWFQSSQFWKDGLSSLKFDNPGHTNNETLNLLAKLTMEDYQGVRDDLTALNNKLQPLVAKLKEGLGFSKLAEWTIGNQASLYTRMFRETSDYNDLVLKNPWDTSNDLIEEERNFLKFFLQEINKDRMVSYNEDDLIKGNNIEYYRLPLTMGSSSSRAAALGYNIFEDIMEHFKDYIKYVNPLHIYRQVKKKANLIRKEFEKEQANSKSVSDDEFFTMINQFDRSVDPQERAEWLKHPRGPEHNDSYEYFEHNLETLLLKHKAAYSSKEHIDEDAPLYKAALIHLTGQGVDQNGEFVQERKYIRDYFKAKIRGESLAESGGQEITKRALAKLREAASLASLGFSPISFTYQVLDGFWKDISLIIRKPDENGDNKSAFTFQNMAAAFQDAFSDLFTLGFRTTKSHLLNELYGLNDMDMNVIYDKIKSDQWGVYNWRSLAFYGASRPDFYNRLSIFGAQMRNDGSWDAHYINEDGRLVYDWTRDERFSKFANEDHSDEHEYQRQKALYYTVAKQFEKEGTRDDKGNLFTIKLGEKKALPRAYTNLEAESMKSLCDTLYGYYSHERKSMIQSTTIGAMWMQYRTYWSGKKNQYLENGGIKLRGSWKQATQRVYKNGAYEDQPLFQVIDKETGLVKYVTKDQIPEGAPEIPALMWKGQWEEGIALTVARLIQATREQKDLFGGLAAIRDDPDFGNVYRANLMQLAYDLTLSAVVGAFVNSYTSDMMRKLRANADKSSIIDGAELAALNIITKSLQKSFLDFNFLDSIGEPGLTWNPFAFTWAMKTATNVFSWSIGDSTLIQLLEKELVSAKTFHDLNTVIDVQLFHGGDLKRMPQYRKRMRTKEKQGRSIIINTLEVPLENTPVIGAIYKEAAKKGMKIKLPK